MEISFLGPLRAVEEGRAVALGGPRQRLVLAHLLVHANEVVAAERLIDDVWGKTRPATVRSTLQSYVSHLRKALGIGRIESIGGGYVLRVDVREVDGLRFEALARAGHRLIGDDPEAAAAMLAEALALWQGPPFADLVGEPSLETEVARLEERRTAAVEDRIAAELAQGDGDDLVVELEALVAAHPLRERLWAHLLLALYRAGRQGEALAAFERARELLADELGIDPSPDLQRLHEQILRQDAALQPAPVVLRGYRLLEQVGQGAFGVVYRALQPHTGREVAVKVGNAELASDPEFIRRFEAEAQAVARLEHPQIAPLYDYWRDPGGAYLARRFVRGGSLRQALTAGPLGVDRAVRLVGQIAAALSVAHRDGVVHGGVTARNVLLDEEGVPYLVDFGIAADRVRRASPDQADAGYLAPERRNGGPPSPRGDLYGLGVLLREALAGPPTGHDGPVSGVPRVLGEIVARSTAADPDARYADAAAFADALRAASPGASTQHAAAQQTAFIANPYRGLRAFTEADARVFFGRETLVNRLLSRLAEDGDASRFLAVVGPSGSGKSSLVKAGLVPALRQGALPGSASWFIAEMHPGTHPLREVAGALLRVAVDPPDGLLGVLERDAHGLLRGVERTLPVDAELVLIVDQLEEVFTLVAEEERRAQFLDALVTAVRDPASRLWVIATLRADFYDRPLDYPGLDELVRTRTETVVRLTAEEVERAVRGPAEHAGVDIEAGLTERIVADVAGQPASLPLLQYALTELLDRREKGALSRAAYEAIGGVAGALAGRADDDYDGLPAAAQQAAHQLFVRLVTLGERAADTRRRVPVAEVLTVGGQQQVMREVVDTFGRSRLLAFDRDPATRAATVEIAHEALLREWARLRSWLQAASDHIRMLARLRYIASDWVDAGHDPSYLLRGSRLRRFEDWAATQVLDLSESEATFLQASIDQREQDAAAEEAKRQHDAALERNAVNRLRALVGVLAVAALVAGGLTVFAFGQTDRLAEQVRITTARGLAAASVANLDVDPQRSILLALEAIATTRDADGSVLPEAEEALHRAVSTSRAILRVDDIGGAVAWSPAGNLFVTEGPEDSGVIDLRDADTGESVRSFHGHDADVNQVDFNHDGAVLATVGDDGAARAWDPATGTPLWAVEGEGEVHGPSFSADGSVFAAAWADEGLVRVVEAATGAVRHEIGPMGGPWATSLSTDGATLAVATWERPLAYVWDLSTGEHIRTLDGHQGPVLDIDHSPDGRWIATSSLDATVRIWEADAGDVRFTLFGHVGPVNAADWSPDSTRLVTGSQAGEVKVWEVGAEGSRELLSLPAQAISQTVGVAFSPDGTRVLAGDRGNAAVKIWDVSLAGAAEWATLPGQALAINAAAFTPDGHHLVATSEGGVPRPEVGSATIWDLDSGEEVARTGPQDGGTVFALDVSPDGALIALATEDTVRLVDARTAVEVSTVQAVDVVTVRWDPAGEVLGIGGREGGLLVVDRSGTEVAALEAGEGLAVGPVAFSPDGRHLAAMITESGRPDPSVRGARIWDWRRNDVVQWIPTLLEGLAYDPTGTLLATAHPSGDVELWDVDSGELTATLTGHSGPVWGFAFSPDGARLATSGQDTTVRLWDLASRLQVLELEGHTFVATDVRFSPDGTRLASAGAEGTIRVWALELDDLMGIARTKLTRGLTDSECRAYLQQQRCAP
jgi:WD40 repeat protein/DNA-binding SARP family transcriptional activator